MFGLVFKSTLKREEENTKYWREKYEYYLNEFQNKIDIITKKQQENNDLLWENKLLQEKIRNLEKLLPKLEKGEIKAALFEECKNCKFVIKYGNRPAGCIKNCVCEYYEENKNTKTSTNNLSSENKMMHYNDIPWYSYNSLYNNTNNYYNNYYYNRYLNNNPFCNTISYNDFSLK